MKSFHREAFFAFLAWLLPFVTSVCMFSLKQSHPPLFDTLMGVGVTASTVLLGVWHMRNRKSHQVATDIRISTIWMTASWLLDGLMFSGGPMKMSFEQYVMDIGLAYLAIPDITVGLGLVAANASARQN